MVTHHAQHQTPGQREPMKWVTDETTSPYAEMPRSPSGIRDAIFDVLDYFERVFATDRDCPGCDYAIHPEPARLVQLRAMPYRDYLFTREWRQTRRGALHRARWRCEECHTKTKTLHVHHLDYRHRGHEWPADLVVLCEDCHGRHHGR